MNLLRTPEAQIAQIRLSQARRLMKEALEILDEVGDIREVGTHLDLALYRLDNHLNVKAAGAGGALELRIALERELLTSSAQAAELP